MTSHMRVLKYCGKVYNIAPRPARNQKNFFAERETGDNEKLHGRNFSENSYGAGS